MILQLAGLLALVFGIALGAAWLTWLFMPGAPPLVFGGVFVGAVLSMVVLGLVIRRVRHVNQGSADTLERRARRLAEASNRRYRERREQRR